ncbi:LOW QUALITY PROTEIN: beta/gamma crystallin domain-containing protein 2 [Leptodactylus fuscus]
MSTPASDSSSGKKQGLKKRLLRFFSRSDSNLKEKPRTRSEGDNKSPSAGEAGPPGRKGIISWADKRTRKESKQEPQDGAQNLPKLRNKKSDDNILRRASRESKTRSLSYSELELPTSSLLQRFGSLTWRKKRFNVLEYNDATPNVTTPAESEWSLGRLERPAVGSELDLENRRPKSCIAEYSLPQLLPIKTLEVSTSFVTDDDSYEDNSSSLLTTKGKNVKLPFAFPERLEGEEEESLPCWAESIIKDYMTQDHLSPESPLNSVSRNSHTLKVNEKCEEPDQYRSPLYHRILSQDVILEDTFMEESQENTSVFSTEDVAKVKNPVHSNICSETKRQNKQCEMKQADSRRVTKTEEMEIVAKHIPLYTSILSQDMTQHTSDQKKLSKNNASSFPELLRLSTECSPENKLYNSQTPLAHTKNIQDRLQKNTAELQTHLTLQEPFQEQIQNIHRQNLEDKPAQCVSDSAIVSPAKMEVNCTPQASPNTARIRYEVIITMTKEEKEQLLLPQLAHRLVKAEELVGQEPRMSPSVEFQACGCHGADLTELTAHEISETPKQTEENTTQEEEILEKTRGGELLKGHRWTGQPPLLPPGHTIPDAKECQDFDTAVEAGLDRSVDRSIKSKVDEELLFTTSDSDRVAESYRLHSTKMEKPDNQQSFSELSKSFNKDKDATNLLHGHVSPQLYVGHVKGLQKVFESISTKDDVKNHKVAAKSQQYGSLKQKKHNVIQDVPVTPGAHGPVYSKVFNPLRKDHLEKRSDGVTVTVIDSADKTNTSGMSTVSHSNMDSNYKSSDIKGSAKKYIATVELVNRHHSDNEANYRKARSQIRDLKLHPRTPTPPPHRIKNTFSLSSPRGWKNQRNYFSPLQSQTSGNVFFPGGNVAEQNQAELKPLSTANIRHDMTHKIDDEEALHNGRLLKFTNTINNEIQDDSMGNKKSEPEEMKERFNDKHIAQRILIDDTDYQDTVDVLRSKGRDVCVEEPVNTTRMTDSKISHDIHPVISQRRKPPDYSHEDYTNKKMGSTLTEKQEKSHDQNNHSSSGLTTVDSMPTSKEEGDDKVGESHTKKEEKSKYLPRIIVRKSVISVNNNSNRKNNIRYDETPVSTKPLEEKTKTNLKHKLEKLKNKHAEFYYEYNNKNTVKPNTDTVHENQSTKTVNQENLQSNRSEREHVSIVPGKEEHNIDLQADIIGPTDLTEDNKSDGSVRSVVKTNFAPLKKHVIERYIEQPEVNIPQDNSGLVVNKTVVTKEEDTTGEGLTIGFISPEISKGEEIINQERPDMDSVTTNGKKDNYLGDIDEHNRVLTTMGAEDIFQNPEVIDQPYSDVKDESSLAEDGSKSEPIILSRDFVYTDKFDQVLHMCFYLNAHAVGSDVIDHGQKEGKQVENESGISEDSTVVTNTANVIHNKDDVHINTVDVRDHKILDAAVATDKSVTNTTHLFASDLALNTEVNQQSKELIKDVVYSRDQVIAPVDSSVEISEQPSNNVKQDPDMSSHLPDTHGLYQNAAQTGDTFVDYNIQDNELMTEHQKNNAQQALNGIPHLVSNAIEKTTTISEEDFSDFSGQNKDVIMKLVEESEDQTGEVVPDKAEETGDISSTKEGSKMDNGTQSVAETKEVVPDKAKETVDISSTKEGSKMDNGTQSVAETKKVVPDKAKETVDISSTKEGSKMDNGTQSVAETKEVVLDKIENTENNFAREGIKMDNINESVSQPDELIFDKAEPIGNSSSVDYGKESVDQTDEVVPNKAKQTVDISSTKEGSKVENGTVPVREINEVVLDKSEKTENICFATEGINMDNINESVSQPDELIDKAEPTDNISSVDYSKKSVDQTGELVLSKDEPTDNISSVDYGKKSVDQTGELVLSKDEPTGNISSAREGSTVVNGNTSLDQTDELVIDKAEQARDSSTVEHTFDHHMAEAREGTLGQPDDPEKNPNTFIVEISSLIMEGENNYRLNGSQQIFAKEIVEEPLENKVAIMQNDSLLNDNKDGVYCKEEDAFDPDAKIGKLTLDVSDGIHESAGVQIPNILTSSDIKDSVVDQLNAHTRKNKDIVSEEELHMFTHEVSEWKSQAVSPPFEEGNAENVDDKSPTVTLDISDSQTALQLPKANANEYRLYMDNAASGVDMSDPNTIYTQVKQNPVEQMSEMDQHYHLTNSEMYMFKDKMTEHVINHAEEEETDSSENMEVWVRKLRQLETPEFMRHPKAPRQPRCSGLSMFATLPSIKEDQSSPKREHYDFTLPVPEVNEKKTVSEVSELTVETNVTEQTEKSEEGEKKYSWDRNTERSITRSSPLELMRKHSGDEVSRSENYKAFITQNLSQRQGSIIASLLQCERLDKKTDTSEGKSYSRLESSFLLSSYLKPQKEKLEIPEEKKTILETAISENDIDTATSKDTSASTTEVTCKDLSPSTGVATNKDTSPSTREATNKNTSPSTREATSKDTSPSTTEATCKDTSPSTTEATNKDTSPSTTEATSKDTSPSTTEATCKDTSPSTTEATNKDTSRSTTEATSKDTSPSTREATNKDTSPSTREATSKDTSPSTTEATSKDTSPTREAISKDTPPSTTEATSKDTSPTTTEATSKDTSPTTTEAISKDTSLSSTEGTNKDKSRSTRETTSKDTSPRTTEATSKDTSVSSTETRRKDTSQSSTEARRKNTSPCTTEARRKDTSPCTTEATNKDTSPSTSEELKQEDTVDSSTLKVDPLTDTVSIKLPTKPNTPVSSPLKIFPDVWHHPEKSHGKLNPRPGKIILFSKPEFRGHCYTIYSDVGNACEWELQGTISVQIIRGGWLLYEKPYFRGRRIMLGEGDTDLTCPWDVQDKSNGNLKVDAKYPKSWIGSLRHVVRDFQVPRISLFMDENGEGNKNTIIGATSESCVNGQPIKTESIIVHSGLWLVYSKPFFEGDPYILEPGGYPNRRAWNGHDSHLCSLQPARIGGPTVEKANDPKILLFQHPEFKGHSWEMTRDLRSLQEERNQLGERLTSVGSLKVLGGCWVAYEKEGFDGHQYLLEEGEYQQWSKWGGWTEELGSLRHIRTDFSEPEIILYEKPGCLEGPCLRLNESLADVEVAQYGTNTGSIQVLNGVWVAYENVDFSGEQYILEKGSYHSYHDWGAKDSQICSVQPVAQVGGQSLQYLPKIQLFSEPNFHGDCMTHAEDRVLLPKTFSPQSCRIEGGSWILYEGEDCSGEQYILVEGDYPTRTAMGCQAISIIQSLKKIPLYFCIPSISLHGLERFEGKELEFTEAVRSLQGEGYNNHVLSVKVAGGIWVLYEHSDFRGRQWLLEQTQITNWLLFSGLQRVGSLCPIRQRRVYFRLRNRALGLFLCVPEPAEDMKAARVQVTEPRDGSCDLWYYEQGRIKNQMTPQMSLQVVGMTAPGTKVVMWSEGRKPIQTWSIEDSGLLMNCLFEGLCLDIKGGHSYDSDHVVVWEPTEDRLTQQWDLEVF